LANHIFTHTRNALRTNVDINSGVARMLLQSWANVPFGPRFSVAAAANDSAARRAPA
jgi:hypothetical protein